MNKTALMIAAAVAAFAAEPLAVAAFAAQPLAFATALAEGSPMPPIDEKCYGVSARDVSVCGSDKLTCAYTNAERPKGAPTLATTGGSENRNEFAYVPTGTCVKFYHGSLFPKT